MQAGASSEDNTVEFYFDVGSDPTLKEINLATYVVSKKDSYGRPCKY